MVEDSSSLLLVGGAGPVLDVHGLVLSSAVGAPFVGLLGILVGSAAVSFLDGGGLVGVNDGGLLAGSVAVSFLDVVNDGGSFLDVEGDDLVAGVVVDVDDGEQQVLG